MMWLLKSAFTFYSLCSSITSCTKYESKSRQTRQIGAEDISLKPSNVVFGSNVQVTCESTRLIFFIKVYSTEKKDIKIIQKYVHSGNENQTVIMACNNSLKCSTSVAIRHCLNLPRYTCLFNNYRMRYTSKELSPAVFKLATKIKSLFTKHDAEDDDTFFQNFKIGEVVEIICEGEIDSRNGMPNGDLMWCKNESGVISDLKLQEKPRIQNTKPFNSECEINQRSSIYYHIQSKTGDADTEIICETGNMDWSIRTCGNGRHRKSIHIRAEQDTTSIMFGPKVTDVYGNSIDGTNLNTTAGGVTNRLRCMTRIPNRNDSKEMIRWCDKGENETVFKPVKLQNTATSVVITNEMTAAIYSDIFYHWPKNHSLTRHFLCEFNYTEKCGSGTVRGNVTLSSNSEDSDFEREDHSSHKDQSAEVKQSHVTLYMYIGVSLAIFSVLVFVTSIVQTVYQKRKFLKAKNAGNSTTHQLREVQFIESSQHENAGNSFDGSSQSVGRTKPEKKFTKQEPLTESSTTYYGHVENSYECLDFEETDRMSIYDECV